MSGTVSGTRDGNEQEITLSAFSRLIFSVGGNSKCKQVSHDVLEGDCRKIKQKRGSCGENSMRRWHLSQALKERKAQAHAFSG